MSTKKGMLLPKALNLVIGVLCLLILFGFSYVLYNHFTADPASESAKKLLDGLVAKVEALDEGQSNTFLVQGFEGAEEWYLAGWGREEADRPDKCFFESCLCVCPGKESEICQESGFCRTFPDVVTLTTMQKISTKYVANPAFTMHPIPEDTIVMERFTQLQTNLFSYEIRKDKGSLIFVFPDVNRTVEA